MHILVEVLSDADGHQLEAVQNDLAKFGLGSSPITLANHIYNSTVFSKILGGRLYPVLEPADKYGIYQMWL
jgi:hypothetical protein